VEILAFVIDVGEKAAADGEQQGDISMKNTAPLS